MLHYTNIEDIVLHSPVAEQSNKLFAISGYVGPEMVKELSFFPKDVHFTIIYGMYGSDNISEPMHKQFMELQKTLTNVDIYYSTVPIHSKIYCWFNNEVVKGALMGSANFTISGLRKNYKETLADVDLATIPEYSRYFDYVFDKCLLCTDPSIVLKKYRPQKTKNTYQSQPFIAEQICRTSLLARGKDVAPLSGLNWGLAGIGDRTSHTALGDAYIAIKKEYIQLFPDLFPIKKYTNGIKNPSSTGKPNRENDEVEIIWDDGTTMIGLMEGQQEFNGSIYPKQISSSPNKNIIGKYLRKRILNKKSVDDLSYEDLSKRITKQDLFHYGRTDIDISKLGEGIYYFDFSVDK